MKDGAEDMMDLPQGARDAMDEWLAGNTGALLHAWIAEDEKSVLGVVAMVGDEAFDSETDSYDVDSIEICMLTVFDSGQEGWDVTVDSDLKLGALFGELANRFVSEDRRL